MDAQVAAKLREPFPDEALGQLPRVWCRACRDAPRGQACGKHEVVKCRVCNNKITTAHLHLTYVGHAETTDRLLAVDPEWTWEPVSFGEDGLPLLDRHGGLWIRLTVAGVTRLGYGHAEGKQGPDAVKEAIGDAIRNAAMRFGVALDLWGATFKADARNGQEHDPPEHDEHPVAGPSPRARALFEAIVNAPTEKALQVQYDQIGPALDAGEITLDEAKQLATHVKNAPVKPDQHKHMHALWRVLKLDGDANRDRRLARSAEIVGLPGLESSADLTVNQARRVIVALEQDVKELDGVGVRS